MSSPLSKRLLLVVLNLVIASCAQLSVLSKQMRNWLIAARGAWVTRDALSIVHNADARRLFTQILQKKKLYLFWEKIERNGRWMRVCAWIVNTETDEWKVLFDSVLCTCYNKYDVSKWTNKLHWRNNLFCCWQVLKLPSPPLCPSANWNCHRFCSVQFSLWFWFFIILRSSAMTDI